MSNSPRIHIARDAGLAAVITTILSLYVFLPMIGQFTQPWAAGDMLSTYVAVDNWGFLSSTPTTEYGYPLGMNLNYFPGVDFTENIFGKVINVLSGNPFLGVNLLLFLSFPATAALTVVALRLVNSRGPIAIMLATAFALIPYHWGRGLGHTYLATNYSVVTGMILVLLVSTGRLQRSILERNKLQLLGILGLAVVTAWTGVYYAVFALILMSAALLWRYAKGDSMRQLGVAVIPIVLVSILVVAGFIPGILATIGDPPYAQLSERLPYESVLFAGILVSALLPAPVFTLGLLGSYNASVTQALTSAPAFENTAPTNFGTLVTTAAIVAMVGGLLLRSRYQHWKRTTSQLPLITYLLSISLLFFIPWGLNYLFAGIVTAQIRAWNRLLPVILLLILIGAGIVLSRFTRRGITLTIAAFGFAATFVNSVMPFQTSYVVSAEQTSEQSTEAVKYSNEINAAVPQSCGILQLPYMGYPENGQLLDLDDYGHFWLPLTQQDASKNWTYGAVKNTEASTWLAAMPEIPGDTDISAMIDAGFCGIHVDSRGYVQPAAQRINTELTQRFGPPAVVGKDGEWNFYQITTEIQDLPKQLPDYFYAPAFLADTPRTGNAGTVAPRGSKGDLTWWWTIAPAANFTIHQLTNQVPIKNITLGLRSSACENAKVKITVSDQTGITIAEPLEADINPTKTTNIAIPIQAESEVATLTITSNGQGCTIEAFPYPQFVQVINATTR